jgi:hypothetical protein
MQDCNGCSDNSLFLAKKYEFAPFTQKGYTLPVAFRLYSEGVSEFLIKALAKLRDFHAIEK